jgi:hypothetical protein
LKALALTLCNTVVIARNTATMIKTQSIENPLSYLYRARFKASERSNPYPVVSKSPD